MALIRPYHPKVSHFDKDALVSVGSNRDMVLMASNATPRYSRGNNNNFYNGQHGMISQDLYHYYQLGEVYNSSTWNNIPSASKKRKISASSDEISWRPREHQYPYHNDVLNRAKQQPANCFSTQQEKSLVCSTSSVVATTSRSDIINTGPTNSNSKRDRAKFEEDESIVFLSRDEIEQSSPSRKDGISPLQETHLRYSYCSFLQQLGFRLDLPQPTIGTAMVLCHRFFFRRSHASHDRYLIATAVLFLASKSEETSRPLNDVLQVSAEIIHRQNFSVLSYMLPFGWFEGYREQIIGAEQLVLTTLNFELTVHHPYESLSATLQKLGLPIALLNLALYFVSEGLRSLLWLQFKPQQIAAGAAYLASKYLNMNLASAHNIWNEFYTPPSVLKDVAHQLMELF